MLIRRVHNVLRSYWLQEEFQGIWVTALRPIIAGAIVAYFMSSALLSRTFVVTWRELLAGILCLAASFGTGWFVWFLGYSFPRKTLGMLESNERLWAADEERTAQWEFDRRLHEGRTR